MRVSQFLLATLKETPADAEIVSHQLMLRAGMIRRLGSGLYTWLPLGLRVLKKVETIVREEMDRSGALEIFMPAVQPAELWEETGRWETFGGQLLTMTDRNKRHYCFGPTHEEVVTDVMRRELHSYKQLPINVYQIQTKFRDEIRSRFGVMRAREFIMKDAYSFNPDQTSLAETYQSMFDCYSRIFTRMGLNYRAVLADTGAIGGSASQEFHVLADSGEDQLFYSDKSDYAANIEQAEALAPNTPRPAPTQSLEKVRTPGVRTIEEVSAFFKIDAKQTLKTLIVKGEEDDFIALILRGDHTLNEVKAEKHPHVAAPLCFATPEDINRIAACDPGSIGPIDLNIPYLIDRSAAVCANVVCGANENDAHYQGVNWERDLPLGDIADLRNVEVGDPSPDGKGHLHTCRGIEVGHIFQLGDKYSQAMHATVLNEQGKAIHPLMGCYGLGISRVVAAAIEQHHDEHGIIWPEPLAPFHVALIGINLHKSTRVKDACEALYEKLVAAGIEVLFDDRKERPGVLFANMDLIGIPHRFVISERGLDAGTIEYKARRSTEVETRPIDTVLDTFLAQ